MPRDNAIAPHDLNLRGKLWFNWLTLRHLRYFGPCVFLAAVLFYWWRFTIVIDIPLVIFGVWLARTNSRGKIRGDDFLLGWKYRRTAKLRVHRVASGPLHNNRPPSTQLDVGVREIIPLYGSRQPEAMVHHTDGSFTVIIGGNFGNEQMLSELEQQQRAQGKRTFLLRLTSPVQYIERVLEEDTQQNGANVIHLRNTVRGIPSSTDWTLHSYLARTQRIQGTARKQVTVFVVGSDTAEKMERKLQEAARKKPDEPSIVEEIEALRKEATPQQRSLPELNNLLVAQLHERLRTIRPLLETAGFEPHIYTSEEALAFHQLHWRDLAHRAFAA